MTSVGRREADEEERVPFGDEDRDAGAHRHDHLEHRGERPCPAPRRRRTPREANAARMANTIVPPAAKLNRTSRRRHRRGRCRPRDASMLRKIVAASIAAASASRRPRRMPSIGMLAAGVVVGALIPVAAYVIVPGCVWRSMTPRRAASARSRTSGGRGSRGRSPTPRRRAGTSSGQSTATRSRYHPSGSSAVEPLGLAQRPLADSVGEDAERAPGRLAP